MNWQRCPIKLIERAIKLIEADRRRTTRDTSNLWAAIAALNTALHHLRKYENK